MPICKFDIDIKSKKIYGTLNNEIIGWIDFKQIETVDLLINFEKLFEDYKNLFLLHNFYIVPEKRNIGFGKQLFKYALDYLIDKNAKFIFLIPEPYEIEMKDNKVLEKLLSMKERDNRLERLVNFYSSFGFNFFNDSARAQEILDAFNFAGKAYKLMILQNHFKIDV